MKEPNMFDDPFIDSLWKMTPDVPAEIKSRLLYECGMAAAETKLRNQRGKFLASAMLGLLVATGTGFFFGKNFSQPAQHVAVVENRPSSEALPAPTPPASFERQQNTTTLAAAMPFNQVFELLDRTSSDDGATIVELPEAIETPLSTLSVLNELE